MHTLFYQAVQLSNTYRYPGKIAKWQMYKFISWSIVFNSKILNSVLVSSGYSDGNVIDTVDLNNQHLFLIVLGARKSETRVPAWAGSDEGLPPGFPAQQRELQSSGLFLPFMGTRPILGVPPPPPWPHLNLISSQRFYLQISSHWGLRCQSMNWWRGSRILNSSQWLNKLWFTHAVNDTGCSNSDFLSTFLYSIFLGI